MLIEPAVGFKAAPMSAGRGAVAGIGREDEVGGIGDAGDGVPTAMPMPFTDSPTARPVVLPTITVALPTRCPGEGQARGLQPVVDVGARWRSRSATASHR